MISNISSTSPYVQVVGGVSFGPYISPGAVSAGMVRYHNNELEVYDGISWLKLTGSVTTVGLSGEAEAAITWASQQRQEQARLTELMAKHPGLRAAYEQFEIMKILVTEEHKEAQ